MAVCARACVCVCVFVYPHPVHHKEVLDNIVPNNCLVVWGEHLWLQLGQLAQTNQYGLVAGVIKVHMLY